MTLQEEAQQIQDYLDIECSENPEEVFERIRAIMPYISRTAFMLAEARKALRRKKASEISNTIINIAKEQCLSAKVQNTLIDSIAKEEANGWYLMQTEKRYWEEEFIDEDTGDPTNIERSETLCGKGTQINDIIKSLLLENDIKTVKVSNIPLLGQQDKNLNLWGTDVKILTGKGNKKSYIVTADSPAAAEVFISEYLEVNLEATFKLIKINEQDYQKVIKIYDSEKEQLELNKKCICWYKAQIYSLFDDGEDEGEGSSAGSRNVLVQATSFDKAMAAIKAVMTQNEFDSIYNTFKKLEELNIVDVFMPDENLVYYSDEDLTKITVED